MNGPPGRRLSPLSCPWRAVWFQRFPRGRPGLAARTLSSPAGGHIMAESLSRRQALGRLGALGAGALALGRPAAFARAPREKLNLAVVGCGGQGAENLRHVAGENIVALCDVDQHRAAEAFKQYPRARRFADYRKMFDALGRQIDAVVVSIPDHMHAPVSLAAMERGYHVYCEKPLTWAVGEARQMAKVAKA